MSTSIRANAFHGSQDSLVRLWIPRASYSELWIYAALCVVIALFVSLGSWNFETGRSTSLSSLNLPVMRPEITPQPPARPARELPVAAENWRAMEIAKLEPRVIDDLRSAGVAFNTSSGMPVAKIDGRDVNGRLPQTIWVKLDQPGNAMLIVETDAGNFVKALEDASPGFASPCRLDANSFGTTTGQPAYFDRDAIEVKAMWLVQDTAAQPGRTPGWIALNPPDESREMPVNVAKF